MRTELFAVVIVLALFLAYLLWLRYCEWVRRFEKGYEVKNHEHDYGVNGICVHCGREDPLRYPPMPPTPTKATKGGRKR